jgi:DNA polymerase V
MTKQLTADYPQEERFELNRRVFKSPETTLLFRMPDDSIKGINVRQGDILLVDRSLKPRDGHYAVVAINGEQTVRQISVFNGQVFIEPPDGKGQPVGVDEPGIKLIGVATAFIPVVVDRNPSPSELEVFMNDSTPFAPLRFVVLSPMNPYERVIVGAEGEVFVVGWKIVQELAMDHLFSQPVSAGTYRINDDQTLEIRTKKWLSPPFTVNVWSEPLLGVLAVYAYQESESAFYYWAPEF